MSSTYKKIFMFFNSLKLYQANGYLVTGIGKARVFGFLYLNSDKVPREICLPRARLLFLNFHVCNDIY